MSSAGSQRRGPPPPGGTRAGRKALSFIKWAGSKAYVMDRLLRFMPPRFGRYFEPMVGSGTVFVTLKPDAAVLGDLNAELIGCYEVLRDQLPALLSALSRHQNTKPHYLEVRAQDPDALDPVARAARTIYLNKTCFNGLYRVNASGQFNVPYGDISWANFRDEPTLRRVSGLLQRASLCCADYEQTVADAGPGDLVYLDPPYLSPGPKDALFYAYQPRAFGEDEHRRLAETFDQLDRRGCHVVLSNSDVPLARELYQGYAVELIETRRPMSCKPKGREGWQELVVHNLR